MFFVMFSCFSLIPIDLAFDLCYNYMDFDYGIYRADDKEILHK